MGRTIKVPQNRATLENTAKQIEESASLFRAIGVSMELDKFEVLKIANHWQLVTALEYLDNFAAAARAALRQEREERGDFRVRDVPESVAGRVGKSSLTTPKRTRISRGRSGKEESQNGTE